MNGSDNKPLLVKICEFFVEDRKRIIPVGKNIPTKLNHVNKHNTLPRSRINKAPITPVNNLSSHTFNRIPKTTHLDTLNNISKKDLNSVNPPKYNTLGKEVKLNQGLLSKLCHFVRFKQTDTPKSTQSCCNFKDDNSGCIGDGEICNQFAESKVGPLKPSELSNRRRPASPASQNFTAKRCCCRSESCQNTSSEAAEPSPENEEVEQNKSTPIPVDDGDGTSETASAVAAAEDEAKEEKERRLVNETQDTRQESERRCYPAYYYFLEDVKTLKRAGNASLEFHSMELLARCLVEVWDEMTHEERKPYFERMHEAEYQKKRKWVLENKK